MNHVYDNFIFYLILLAWNLHCNLNFIQITTEQHFYGLCKWTIQSEM